LCRYTVGAGGKVRGVDDLGEEVAVFSGAFLACAQRQDCAPSATHLPRLWSISFVPCFAI
jgi:hypothetical protein